MRHWLLALLLTAFPAFAGEPLRIAVAANFKPTLERINAAWARQGRPAILLSSASTGVLATQVLKGAPYHLFLAADTAAPATIAAAGAGEAPFCYALGRLVLAGGDMTRSLADPGLDVAIANPETAPYGRAAMEVLARPEFAGGTGRRLVRGNNAAQAAQFWHSGAVALALLPRSLAPAQSADIPAQWHAPIEQHALVLAPHPQLADYLRWIRSDTVRSLILDAGYAPCP